MSFALQGEQAKAYISQSFAISFDTYAVAWPSFSDSQLRAVGIY